MIVLALFGALFVILTSGVPCRLSASALSTQQLNGSAAYQMAVDIARANLLCTQGLPGENGLGGADALKTIDRWASLVESETRRNWHRFEEQPAEYENSEVFYRMGMLVTVLQEDLGVRYNPDLIDVPEEKVDEAFLSDPSNMFLTGVLGPKRFGTCSSMPVLYAAIGRRLGYPLYLVTAKDHLFLRWQNAGEATYTNIEATNHGITFPDDGYYSRWRRISADDIKGGRELRSLTPSQEIAIFMQTRAAVLQYHGRWSEALEAYEEAARLWPENAGIQTYIDDLRVKLDEPYTH